MPETTTARKTSPEHSFVSQFESLAIPDNIDPRLLELWIYREQEEIEKNQRRDEKKESSRHRKLTWLFASYVGIVIMCFAIISGLIQGQETEAILKQTCQAFLVFTIIGFFAGWIIEYCVVDSVESLLREAVKRSQEAAEARRVAEAELIEEALRRT